MKRSFAFLAFLLLSLGSFASDGPSRLSISAAGSLNIRVIVDGIRYRASNNMVMISHIREGNHMVQVYLQKNNQGEDRGRDGDVMRNYRVVFESNVFIKPLYHVDITINRFGKAFTDEQHIVEGDLGDEDDNWANNYNNNDRNNNDRRDNDDKRDNNEKREKGFDNRRGPEAMEAGAFNQFREALRKESFDDTKQNMAKEVITANYFSAAQVKEILMQFNFDDSKLEIAKFAYKNTVDKGNYYLVNDAFTFSTSKDELIRYIRDYK